MLSYRDRALRFSCEIGDGLLAALCLLVAARLRCSDTFTGVAVLGPFATADDLYLSAAIAGVASTWTFRWSGVYSYVGNRSICQIRGKLVMGWAFAALGLLAAGPVFGLDTLEATLVLLYAPIHLTGLAAWRLLVSGWLRQSRKRNGNESTFVTVGSDSYARRVAARLTAEWGFRNLGFVDDEPVSLDVEKLGKLYLGSAKELDRLLEREVVDEVVVALPPQRLSADSTIQAITLCETVGLDVTIVSDLFRTQRAKLRLHGALGDPALSFTSFEPRSLGALAIKRGIDTICATIALAVSLPLWLAAAIAIKLDSPGPIFFVQQRCGLHGRTFPFLKFRTMKRDAERHLTQLRVYNEVPGPVFKMSHDPRMTRVGRFLRLSSIDELPQLINVLLGHMSLVGPRPPIPSEVDQYELVQRRRLSVRPGLTCLWQISGRSLLGFEDWVRLDLEYIDQWSLLLDFSIMARTVPAVLTARGAS